ncbi:putative ribonuclease H-like domain-containing protein [Tanacetum coccineum]
MLADSFLPNTFWAEAVSTACYVLNRVLVTKPQNKTPYELITGKIPIISYIRPFGCHVTILNTIDHLGKFEGKSDEGFLVGYSLNSKAFRVYNLETKRVEENLHINFLENKPNVAGKGPNWLFDLDYLTDSMNYQPVRSENQANKTAGPEEANHSAGTQDNIDAGNSEMEADPAQDYFVLPIYSSYTSTVKSSEAKNEGEKPNKDTGLKTNEEPVDQEDQAFLEELERLKRQEKEANDAAEALRKEFAQEAEDLLLQAGAARATSTNTVNTVRTPVSTASSSGGPSYPDLTNYADQDDSQIPALEDIYDNPNDGIFTNASYDDEGAVADFTNLESTVNVSPIPTSRIHSIHPTTQILGDPKSAVQTRSKVNKSSGAHAFVSYIQKQRRNNHKDFQHCLFACFLSQIEPKKISEALEDESWVDAMQEELLQFKIQKVWILVDLPYGKKAIGTKWVYRNKKDERGVVVRNKARIEAINDFLAFASYMGFIVYQMDVKSAFLYGIIDEEVYVSQPSGILSSLRSGYRRGTIDKTLFIKKDKNDIMLVQVYVDDIIFGSTKSTPIETQKPLTNDEEADDVDIHLYRSMIGSLMYLTSYRPDIMFAVCACSRFQETYFMAVQEADNRGYFYYRGISLLADATVFKQDAYEKKLIPSAEDSIIDDNVFRGGKGDHPPVTDSSSSHDTTQDSKDSLEDTNGSKGTQAWLKSVKRLSMKKRLGRKESVSKQGRKNAKLKPTLDAFDDLDADKEPEPAKKMTRSDFDATLICNRCRKRPTNTSRLASNEERERQREEEASKAVINETYDEVQAGIDADALFAAKLQQAAQRSAEIRKIQGLYERQKRVIDDFNPIDSDDAVKDSKEATGVHKQKVLEEPNSTKVEVKQEGHEESIKKRPGKRLKMKETKKSKRQKTDADN